MPKEHEGMPQRQHCPLAKRRGELYYFKNSGKMDRLLSNCHQYFVIKDT
jgi:hypothetical protein